MAPATNPSSPDIRENQQVASETKLTDVDKVKENLEKQKRGRQMISDNLNCCNISSDGKWIFYATDQKLLKATSVEN